MDDSSKILRYDLGMGATSDLIRGK
jgi:hypothetical protein